MTQAAGAEFTHQRTKAVENQENDKQKKSYTHHPDYARLPKVLKTLYTPEEYAWLGDDGRNNLLESATTPEVYDDSGC